MAKASLLHLGRLLRDRRGERGIREVASEIGISSATLSRVERGKLPDLETFAKICEWLDVDPAEMLQIRTTTTKKKRGETSDVMVAAHLRADSTPEPEAAQDLAQLILAVHRAVAREEG